MASAWLMDRGLVNVYSDGQEHVFSCLLFRWPFAEATDVFNSFYARLLAYSLLGDQLGQDLIFF